MCTIAELRNKEVVNVRDGARLGRVFDIEVDVVSGCVVSLIVPERAKFFSFFSREFVIPWKDVCMVGEDLILVDTDACMATDTREKRPNSFC